MKKRRLELQALLETLLESRNVYFQPPSDVKMKYPCIIYSRSDIDDTFANNSTYIRKVAYTVTVVSKDPDNDIVSKVVDLPSCTYNRSYVADGLNHDTFTLYY